MNSCFSFSFLVEMERQVALYTATRGSFFEEATCINCSVDDYCACNNADLLFDIESVMRKRMCWLGEGVGISEPVRVDKGLRSEYVWCHVSLSFYGVLAIYSTTDNDYDYQYIKGDGIHIVQLTDLNTDRQVEFEVEELSNFGFYDGSVILLTFNKPLREAIVEDIFRNHNLERFKNIGTVDNAFPVVDSAVLNETRVLYYNTLDSKLFSYNVDTKINTQMTIEQSSSWCTSLTGIDCGVRRVFQDEETYTYILTKDDTVIKVDGKKRDKYLKGIFPSSSDSTNLSNAAFRYGKRLMIKGKKIYTETPIKFGDYGSIIRVYRDIFLLFDRIIMSWVLSRIVVP